MLGEAAKDFEQQHRDIAIAVLFRDSDGAPLPQPATGQPNGSRCTVVSARRAGARGVPMLPKPKSEAWLLCAVANAYQHCQKLEALPGNDDSPHSAKMQLQAALGGDASTEAQLNWLAEHGFDHQAVAADMPSYQQFKASLAAAIDEVRRPRRNISPVAPAGQRLAAVRFAWFDGRSFLTKIQQHQSLTRCKHSLHFTMVPTPSPAESPSVTSVPCDGTPVSSRPHSPSAGVYPGVIE